MESQAYVMEAPPGPVTYINGIKVDYFGGCSYFSFHRREEIIRAAVDALLKYGIGSATSRLGYGNNPALLDVERKAASFFETEESLYIPAGYFGMKVLLEGLRGNYDMAFVDDESHYSVRNACLSTSLETVFFKHLDAGDLEKQIRTFLKPGMKPIVLSDGIFPVTGEIPPLNDYLVILEGISGSSLCIDDAHATGVIGRKGKGSYEYLNISPERGVKLYLSGNLSKALGGHGGIIYGERDYIKMLREKSSALNASIPAPVPAAAASAAALDILSREPELRVKLWENVKYLKGRLREMGLSMDDSPVPIICIGAEKGTDLKKLQHLLFHKKGIAVTYVGAGKYTSVPQNGAIRISVFSDHSMEQINRLVEELAGIL